MSESSDAVDKLKLGAEGETKEFLAFKFASVVVPEHEQAVHALQSIPPGKGDLFPSGGLISGGDDSMANIARIVESQEHSSSGAIASAAGAAVASQEYPLVEMVGSVPGSVAMVRAVCPLTKNRIATGDLRGIVRIYKWEDAKAELGAAGASKPAAEGDGAASGKPRDGPPAGEFKVEHEIVVHPRNTDMLAGVMSMQQVPESAARAWGVPGRDLLLTGGQDGAWSVVDLETGEKLHRHEGSDNGTPAVVLADGRVAAAAAGRKQGQGYAGACLRMWKPVPLKGLQGGGGGGEGAAGGDSGKEKVAEAALAGFVLERCCEEHDLAVRAVCALPSSQLPEEEAKGPDGSLAKGPPALATVSNDGNLRLWTRNGAAKGCVAVSREATAAGQGVFTFAVACIARPDAPGGAVIAVGSDDRCLRLFSLDLELLQAVALPGVPWAIAGLPNGDIAVGTDQARGRAGHVLVLSQDPARQAQEGSAAAAAFQQMMNPPAAAAGSGGAPGAGGAGSTSGGSIPVRGEFAARDSIPGSKDGDIALFRDSATGGLKVCQWSAVGGAWNVEGDYVGDSDGGQPGAANGSVPSGAGGAGASTMGEMLTAPVAVDLPGGGAANLTLSFGSEERPESAADRFLHENRSQGIEQSQRQQIIDFIMQVRQQRGLPARPDLAPRASARRFKHFPCLDSRPQSSMPPMDKVLAKVREASDKLEGEHAGAKLTVGETGTLGMLVDRLKEEGKRHSDTIPAPESRLLLDKIMLQWPGARLVAASELFRIAALFETHRYQLASKAIPLLAKLADCACAPGLKPGQVSRFAGCLVNMAHAAPVRRAWLAPAAAEGSLKHLDRVLGVLLNPAAEKLWPLGGVLALNLAVAAEQEQKQAPRNEALAECVARHAGRALAAAGDKAGAGPPSPAETFLMLALGTSVPRAKGAAVPIAGEGHGGLLKRLEAIKATGDATGEQAGELLQILAETKGKGAGAGAATGGAGGH